MNIQEVDVVGLELLEGSLDGNMKTLSMVAGVVDYLALSELVAAIIGGISSLVVSGH